MRKQNLGGIKRKIYIAKCVPGKYMKFLATGLIPTTQDPTNVFNKRQKELLYGFPLLFAQAN